MRARLLLVAGLGAALLVASPTADAQAPTSGAPSAFTPVSPVRVVDTRNTGPIPATAARDFQITGSLVPATASAVMINVTATRAQAGGWLQVLPTGQAAIGSSSTLNLDEAGRDTPNASFAPLGDGGKLTVYTTFTTDVIIDVFGYFTPTASSGAGRLTPLTPSRILDTRSGVGWTPPTPPPPSPPGPNPPANPGDTKNCSDFATYAEAKAWFDVYYPYYGDVAHLDGDGDLEPCESLPGGPSAFWLPVNVPTNTTITLQVAGRGGVPATGASAVVMNVTAADPQSDGWVQVAPTPVSVGASSNLNTTAGRTVANLVVVPVSAGGTVDLYTSVNTDLLADVVGYFTNASAPVSTAGLFVPITPYRQVDTRTYLPDGLIGTTTVTFGVEALTMTAAAIAGNVTAADAEGSGWVQVAAPPLNIGASSNLNVAYDGQTVANAFVSPVADSQVAAYTFRSAHLLVDVTGWFTQGAPVTPSASAALQQLATLGTTSGTPGSAYNRDEWLPDWADGDGDCRNTRTEVLIAEADGALTLSASGCTVTAGVWNDSYTAVTFTDPQDVDIDHLVPLADAHRSGGWTWPTATKQSYANDLTHDDTLIAVDDGSNSAKGDKSPDKWMPPNHGYWCTYAISWVTVKATWSLTVTSSERSTLSSVLSGC